MGVIRKRHDASPEDWRADPEAALRLAREAIAACGTYVDHNGNRCALTPTMRERMTASIDCAARAYATPSAPPRAERA